MGMGSEVEQFLQNNEETQGYEGLRRQADMNFYRFFAEEQIIRDRKGRIPRTFKQFANKPKWAYKSRVGFMGVKANVEKMGGGKSIFSKKSNRVWRKRKGLN